MIFYYTDNAGPGLPLSDASFTQLKQSADSSKHKNVHIMNCVIYLVHFLTTSEVLSQACAVLVNPVYIRLSCMHGR